uniref:PI-PLC Y-box domain-containing protein n=1 Tax=viral metagenome TaxID=1070528 RepID=A0A6C0EXN9_9ZZZZ
MANTEINQYKSYISIIAIVGIMLVLIFYISRKLDLKKSNCAKIGKNTNLSLLHTDSQQMLSSFFIKTAYNCCCTGNFRNDYVDLCSLINCAGQGVRALDFQIYSLKNKPIISASTVTSTNYKEIYNYLDFYDTMINVKRYFIDDPASSANNTDPLFLIFRLYSTNTTIYDSMADALNSVFGFANPTGNIIYMASSKLILDNETLSNLNKKVIIIVDPTYGDPAKFNSSKLNWYNSLTMGTQTNNVYRENDAIINVSDILAKSTTHLSFLYPDVGLSSSNYDFITTGIFNKISFIGMNFQTNDKWLTTYTTFFNKNAFIDKTITLDNAKSVNAVAYAAYQKYM